MAGINTIERIKPSDWELIDGRNAFISQAKKSQELSFSSRKPHALLLRLVARLLIASTELTGQQNLDLVRGNHAKQWTIAARHASDADHQALDHTLRGHGYSDVSDRLYFAAGLKMWDRPQTRWAMPALNSFPVAAPGYFEEAAEMAKIAGSSEEGARIAEYTKSMRWLNMAAMASIMRRWQSGEMIVVIYPETTRTRNGLLQRGREETNSYFKRGLILPVATEGPSEVFPVGRGPKWEMLLKRQFQLKVAVGEPINGERLQELEVKDWLKERGANQVDFVMSRIHSLNPDNTDPLVRPLYDSLQHSIPASLLVRV